MRWTPKQLQDLRRGLDAAYPDARCALDHRDPFQLVVATILSAQCTDARVNLTTPALFARYPDAARLAAADLAELEALIRPTGFFRNKARNLVGLGQALVARHGGAVPSDPAALSALPGVGQKTANVVLANAFGIPALAVDTHIFRVARRLGLSEAATPEKVEADLCRAFPRESWIALHHQLIWHGRRCCEARRPACASCPLHALCPTGRGLQADPHTGAPVRRAPSAEPPRLLPAPGAEGPRRIVSLVPSLTELLARWGLAARLAGRTRFCVAPSWIRATVPALGGPKDPDLEALEALAPDLVLMERDENSRESAEALARAGLPTLVLKVDSLRACAAELRRLGAAVGAREAAEAEAAALEAELRPAPRRGPRALVLLWKEPWIAAGTGTCLGDLVRQGGFRLVGGARYPRLDGDDLEALAPDLVLLPDDPFPWKERDLRELQRRFPDAEVRRVDGRALAWNPGRSLEGLALLRKLRAGFPP